MNSLDKLNPSLMDRGQFALLAIKDIVLYLLAKRYRTFISTFRILSPRYLHWTSRIRARRAYYHAVKKVPAYFQFLKGANVSDWNDIPCTDKESYVQKYEVSERCVNGVLPTSRIMIDESSGSTGTPYNWVRNTTERKQSHAFISYFARFCFGGNPSITINAFSMGAWATGLNMGVALERNGIVKNCGPDIPKILNTLEFLGAKQNYLITGYPPFLKQLMDYADAQDFPIRNYNIDVLAGGEGMSEGLRDYLKTGFNRVFSGYGATDLEIGISGETPVAVAIRRLARENDEIRKALFGVDSRLPMVFQYNPLMHYIETNSENELIFTITRKSLLSPRIKYNIHDEGGVARYDHIAKTLKKFNIDIDDLTRPEDGKNIRFPIMWVYGRKDYTISVMGANIYPEDLEQCVYADRDLARITRSFCQSLEESENSNVRPSFSFEVTVNPDNDLKEKFGDSILKSLIEINSDFREAWQEYPQTLVPAIHLYKEGQGPFKMNEGKIKQVRLLANN